MDAHDPPHLKFNFDNSFARSLEGFFVSCQAEPAITPKLLQFNHALAAELGLDPIALDSEAGVAIFSGNVIPELGANSPGLRRTPIWCICCAVGGWTRTSPR